MQITKGRLPLLAKCPVSASPKGSVPESSEQGGLALHHSHLSPRPGQQDTQNGYKAGDSVAAAGTAPLAAHSCCVRCESNTQTSGGLSLASLRHSLAELLW